jgi:hypothetical protein
MRTCHTRRRALRRACYIHSTHSCVTVIPTGAHTCAPIITTGAHTCARVYPTGAPLRRALIPYPRAFMRVYSVNRRACTRTFHGVARALGPTPTKKSPKTPVRPPVPTLPKNLKPIAMQDVQTTNLKLARREMDASCSRNHSISSGSALELTVAVGTNEVAMWALQLYIGFFPTSNHHSGSPRRPFFKPSSATGSASRHLHHACPWATFYPVPPGCLFCTSWPGTHTHCHIYLIHVHIWY